MGTDGDHLFGVRHHGPGSARSLVRALEALDPDIVLIEGPPDANDLLPLAANVDLKPPVALLVYAPVAHWIWHPEGWLHLFGHKDFAGGTVVHLASGVAGLVLAGLVGPRLGYGREPMPPHNLLLTTIGAGLLATDHAALARWIAHTDRVKPRVRMPAFDMLPAAEVELIAAYLMALE